MATNAIVSNSPFRFLDLPFELRKLVYAVLFQMSCVIISQRPSDNKLRFDTSSFHSAILRTCRLIRDEASRTLLGNTSICSTSFNLSSLRNQPSFTDMFKDVPKLSVMVTRADRGVAWPAFPLDLFPKLEDILLVHTVEMPKDDISQYFPENEYKHGQICRIETQATNLRLGDRLIVDGAFLTEIAPFLAAFLSVPTRIIRVFLMTGWYFAQGRSCAVIIVHFVGRDKKSIGMTHFVSVLKGGFGRSFIAGFRRDRREVD